METSQREVGIVGAGMTGLCVCKHLLQQGFKPTVFESRDRVGGIWQNTCSITKLQTSRHAYQFSDFLWPEGTPLNPHNEQVVHYLENYAVHFQLQDRILFNCKVVEVKANTMACDDGTGLWGSSGRAFADARHQKAWQLLVERRKSPLDKAVQAELFEFDFLVLCVGRFGDFPKYPEPFANQGPSLFSGKVMHSMEYGTMDSTAAKEMLSGKRVVVVGFMKSAIEMALEASAANEGPPMPSDIQIYKLGFSQPEIFFQARIAILLHSIFGAYEPKARPELAFEHTVSSFCTLEMGRLQSC